MSNRFFVPDESPPPSTPDRRGGRRGIPNPFLLGEEPSTTPAGPPPSSAASFTPVGAPTASYMGSSIMHGVTSSKSTSFGNRNAGSSSKNLFGRAGVSNGGSALGRSVISTTSGRQPSKLSKTTAVDDDDDDDDDEEEGDEEEGEDEDDERASGTAPRTFEVRYDDDSYAEDEGDAEGEDASDEDYTQEQPHDDHHEDGMEDGDEDTRAGGDMWLDMDQAPAAPGELAPSDETDLMIMATSTVDDRVRREAEDIFRASSMRFGDRKRQFDYSATAKTLYEQPVMQYATVTEPPEVILGTENLISRLYDEGVGPEDDEERLGDTLANVAGLVTSLWRGAVENMPRSDEEHAAGIGPGPHASPFERAAYLATFSLRVHHTRCDEYGRAVAEPLPETLFRWLADSHDLYPNQVQDILRHKPSPACHALYWQTVFIALLRGKVGDVQNLLKLAGWEHVRKRPRGEYQYQGRALENVQRAAEETCTMLETCPGKNGNWDIWSSDWTLFRIRARGALNQLLRFAEGKDEGLGQSEFADSSRLRQSMAGRAREAESQVPWEIYTNLRIMFEIALGSVKTILDTAQDWCEATIGLFGWWDEGHNERGAALSQSLSFVRASQSSGSETYLDRLSRAFHTAVQQDFQVNTMNPVEVGMACVFEDNAQAVIGILRSWSLPVAAAVAEIASLGRWLPPHTPTSALYGMEDLDMDDLEVLGVDAGSPDEADGVKDNTLIQYAQELINYKQLSTTKGRDGNARDGWELAIHVLGRMDSPERSEEMVGELVRDILETIDADSGHMVDKIWALLNDLGMIEFAENAVEHYGDVLADSSHRYGEAMWYYALAHRPGRIREVVNLLVSYSLIQSAAYPLASELDDHLGRLLSARTVTLEELADQDLEAAELLGKMLSGYATLRRFYQIRDDEDMPPARRQRAAMAALSVVIASSDDNIRGGLYDVSRDAIVSECFLLSLLGEALVFVDQHGPEFGRPALVNLDQVDVLLKAIEDIEAVGPKVFNASDEFFQLVLTSAPGMKGSTPGDLMTLSKPMSASGSGSAGGSFVMTGSSMLASRLHRALGPGGTLAGKGAVTRGWDWRTGLVASTSAKDILRRLRRGLTKDLARLWLEQADSGF